MPSKKSQQHMRRAREYMDGYKYSRAIEELKAALELETENADLESLLAEAEQKLSNLNEHKQAVETLKQERRYEEAEAEIEKALKLNPVDDALEKSRKELNAQIQGQHLRVAQTLRKEFRLEESIEEFKAVLARNPKNANAQHGLREAQKTKEALDLHLNRAEEYHAEREYAAAIAEYEQVLKIHPSHGRSTKGIRNCREILEEIESLKGVIEQSRAAGAFSRTIESLKRLQTLTTISGEMELLLAVTRHNERAETLKNEGRLEESEAEILQAIEISPDDSRLLEMRREVDLLIQDRHLQTAADLVKEYKFEEAIDEYQKQLKRNPDDQDTRNALKEAERIAGEIGEHLLRAEKYRKRRRYQKAANEYEKVAKLNPEHAFAQDKMRECVDALALIELAHKELDEALSVKHFEKAIESLEKLSELEKDAEPVRKRIAKLKKVKSRIERLLSKGNALFDEEKYHKAIAELQKVLKIDDKHQEALSLIRKAESAIEELIRKRKTRIAYTIAAVIIAITSFVSYKVWNHSQYKSYMTQAQNTYANEDWIAADSFCDKALRHKPGDQKGLSLSERIGHQLEIAAIDTQKEMLTARKGAIESMAEVYAKPFLEQAAETEAQSASLLESQQYTLALQGHRMAINEYNTAKKRSLASMAKAKENADKARAEMERLKSGLDRSMVNRFTREQYEAARQAEQQAEKHYKKNMYVPAKDAYRNANSNYQNVRATVKAKEESKQKALNEKKEMAAVKRKIDMEKALQYARVTYTSAIAKEKEASRLFFDGAYAEAEATYILAKYEYASTLQTLPEGSKEANPTAESAEEKAAQNTGIKPSPAKSSAIEAFRPDAEVKQEYLPAENDYESAGATTRTGVKGMVLIPGGEFMMGSPAGVGEDDEHPQHKVYLDSFYLDTHEVTVGQYKEFIRATGHRGLQRWVSQYSPRDTHPVVGVTWDDAAAYAKWAGKRLPTEAEWEYACRGTKDDDAISQNDANCKGTGAKDKWKHTAPVGSFPPNDRGLYDMHGNVFEWCSDWYGKEYYRSRPTSNPRGPLYGQWRVVRGGAWHYKARNMRSANRHGQKPDEAGDAIGFRCAMDAKGGGKGDSRIQLTGFTKVKGMIIAHFKLPATNEEYRARVGEVFLDKKVVSIDMISRKVVLKDVNTGTRETIAAK